jgi:hypothetical protein
MAWDINLYANVIAVAQKYKDLDESVDSFLSSFTEPNWMLRDILEDARMIRIQEIEVLDEYWNSSWSQEYVWTDDV